MPKQNNTPLVSIISVNYNGLHDTFEMIESLKTYLDFSFELIIIDNTSVVDEAEKISMNYPWVKVVRSERNLGFAGGNNMGIKQARGKYVFLLNNDTFVTDNSLINLVSFLEKNPKAGAVSPKIKFAAIPDEIQFAGYTEFSKITLRNYIIGYGEKDRAQYEKPTKNPFLHGAAMMVRLEAIEKAGLMPDIYFLYYEELDWCERIKDAGFELWYVPTCTVFHKESKSVGISSPLKNYYQTRNRLLFGWRNLKGVERYMTIGYQLTAALSKNVVVSLLSKRGDLAKAALKGAAHFITMKK